MKRKYNRKTKPEAKPFRVIKRYKNRKLYDTQTSEYVTLIDVYDLVRKGYPGVMVIDFDGRDITARSLLQVIFEKELNHLQLPSVETLSKHIISGEILFKGGK